MNSTATKRVAYLGPDGTFAHIVASQRFDGDNASYFPKNSIAEVFEFVRNQSDAYGIVPIENSSGGNIYGTIDELVDRQFNLQIVDQMELNVKLSLMGKPANLNNAKKLYSHFAALNHCHEWVTKNYSHLEAIPTASTAEAAKLASESDDSLALASSRSAQFYGLNIIATPPQTRNVTQFITVSGKNSHNSLESKGDRRSTVVVTLPSSAGSLCDFLLPFKEHNVNLSRILSRPIKGTPHEYAFLIDIDGALESTSVSAALAYCKSKNFYISLNVIGNYAKYEKTFES